MQRFIAVAGLCLVINFSAQAQGADRSFNVLLSLGFTQGGSSIDSTNEFDRLQAGRGLMLCGGAEAPVGERIWLQGRLCRHVDGPVPFGYSDAKFTRYPIDVLAHYAPNDKVRVGAGVEWVTSAKVTGTDASDSTRNFGSTVGLVLEAEYRFRPWIGLKLGGVAERFKESGTNNRFSGNQLGLLNSRKIFTGC